MTHIACSRRRNNLFVCARDRSDCPKQSIETRSYLLRSNKRKNLKFDKLIWPDLHTRGVQELHLMLAFLGCELRLFFGPNRKPFKVSIKVSNNIKINLLNRSWSRVRFGFRFSRAACFRTTFKVVGEFSSLKVVDWPWSLNEFVKYK